MTPHKPCIFAGQDRAHAKRKTTGVRKPLCYSCKRTKSGTTKVAYHGAYVLKTYGITGEEYATIKALQNGKCAICQRATGVRKSLAVDHDHSLEKKGVSIRWTVRGLLCGTCNKMLGHLRDDIEAFQRAIVYLTDPPAWKVISGKRQKIPGENSDSTGGDQ